MLLEDIYEGMRVCYMPHHARGKRHHRDCMRGVVTSKNAQDVSVRYGADRHSNITAPALLIPDDHDERPLLAPR